ncbi:MAG: tRNA (adenosine(37)-N6)-dimethylallyltransferase MiaA [Deltaproteobacteria bacterium]|jgi:tRNA dimethylallyltransferase
MPKKPCVIIISGPTCVGKTEAAITLAKPLGGEIISADAMQVYRHMDIGTAKPTKQEQARVPHHLIDMVSPDEPFSAAQFKSSAAAVIRELHKKGRPVFVVGGTGLYIKALTHGLFRVQQGNGALRERLRAEAKDLGSPVLHQRLQEVDPDAAGRIHPNDGFRIIRALEIFELTGKPISEHHSAHGFSDVPYHVLKIGLFLDREVLYQRIDQRVDRMLEAGLLKEVEGLLRRGYSPNLKSMGSIGYRHMAAYLEGHVAWDETVRLFKRDTRRYAKRQLAWFRADPEILWLKPSEIDVMSREIDSFLTQEGFVP